MPQDTTWPIPNSNADVYPVQSLYRDSMSGSVIVHSYNSKGSKTAEDYSIWALPVTLFMLATIWIIIRLRDGRSTSYVEIGTTYENMDEEIRTTRECLCYEGSLLIFSEAELILILKKRLPYFSCLSPFEKGKFIQRLKKFIASKTFKIHDDSGFKEMPVLISATAIQLSFGLEKYLLPDFPYINIFPQEFIGVHPSIRFLEGNVSGNSINISWKHFLNGFEFPENGQNVGLHEMAHAYYFQNFETGNNINSDFVATFSKFNVDGNNVFEQEQKPGNDLYTEYAMKNFQEFWAETIEIFFEKPCELKVIYPNLYSALTDLLNQDPATKTLTV